MDGFAVEPIRAIVSRSPWRSASTSGSRSRERRRHPVLAILEGERRQTGIILAAAALGSAIPDMAETPVAGADSRSGAPPARHESRWPRARPTASTRST